MSIELCSILDPALTTIYATREEWLTARRGGVGSSDVPAILGLTNYGSRLSVYVSKIEDTPVRDDAPSEAAKWGQRVQSCVLAGFGQDVGRETLDVAPTAIVKHPSIDWAIASLDGIQVNPQRLDLGPGLAEIKNVGYYRRDDWEEQAPIAFQAQLQAQLFVTGLGWGSVIGLLGGNELVYADYLRDENFITSLLEMLGAFWAENVLARVPPEPTGTEADLMALRKLYPRLKDGGVVKLPREFQVEADEYLAINEQAAALEARKKQIKAKVLHALGEAQFGDLGDAYCWKRNFIEKAAQAPTSYMDLRRVRKPAHLW